MTVSVQVPVTSTIANGSTTVFPYSFKILAAADLSVSLAGVKQTTGFTIAGVGAETGNITFSVAPANGVKVTASRDPVLSRLTDYQQFGPWPAQTLNKDFDSMWLALQAFENDALRALKLPVDTATDQLINFTPGERASSLISFDANGNLNLTPLSALAVTVSAGSFTTDTFSGNGATVAFAMSRAPGIKGNTYVFVGGAYIRKDQYSISSTTITFNVAPATGTNNIEVCQSVALIAGSPADDTVSVASLQAGVLAATVAGLAKMAAGYFTATAEARAKFADGFMTVAKMSTTDVSPFSRTVLDDLDAPAWRATIGVVPATDVLAGLIELATNAEVTAGTDAVRAVTPAGLRGGLNATGTAPIYACRAWVNFNGATGAVIAGGNVASVTRNGVGDYTINFATALPDANYSGFAACGENNGIWGGGSNATTAATTTAWRINFRAIDNSLRDVALGFVGIFR